MKHFNKLTPGEAERLAVLSGECAEVIQAISKILRHGYESHNPTVANSQTNREDLQMEIGHVFNAVEMLYRVNDVDAMLVLDAKIEKADTIQEWLHHTR